MSWENYKDKVNRYFAFSKTEWKDFAWIVLVFAFILSFTQWGAVDFDAVAGLKNFVGALIIVGVSVFVHHSAQRLLGVFHGYRVEQRLWLPGLLVGLLVLIISNGRLMIFAASSMFVHMLPAHRLGTYRYGPKMRQIGRIALVGPVASLVLAVIFYAISPDVFGSFLMFNLLFASFSLLPIPPLDGAHVFFGARTAFGSSFVYLFTVCGLLGFFVLYTMAEISFLWSVIIGALIGVFCWFVFSVLAEK